MSCAKELPKVLMDFLETPIPDSYPRTKHVIEGHISATHSTYLKLDDPWTKFERMPVIQDATIARVVELFEGLPRANREKLLEDIHYVAPVFLEASASLMLNHHVLIPVKVVLNLLWTAYLNNIVASKDQTDNRIYYLLKHFEYGFAIRAQHQDASDVFSSRQDHILTFEPYRRNEDIKTPIIRPAGASGCFSTDDEFNSKLAEIVSSIGRARDNERSFMLAFKKKAPIDVKTLPCLAMTIIEEKKPGTLSPNAWQDAHNHIGSHVKATAAQNERKITAQILGYAFLRNCSSVLVSQFDVNVILKVENPACGLLIGKDGVLDLERQGTATVIVDEDNEQRTPREKLFYMVVERALNTVLRGGKLLQ